MELPSSNICLRTQGELAITMYLGNLTFTDGITRAMKVLFIKCNEALLCFSKIV